MFRKIYNKVIVPLITFLLPGLTWSRLFYVFIAALTLSYIWYLLVDPRVNNIWWKIILAGFGALFVGGLLIRTIAYVIRNYLLGRSEVITEATTYERSKKK